MFNFFKKSQNDAEKIYHVIELLASYHAMPISDEKFQKTYKHLIKMHQLYERTLINVR